MLIDILILLLLKGLFIYLFSTAILAFIFMATKNERHFIPVWFAFIFYPLFILRKKK